ncbi:YbaN family protein [Endozoicomonas arenosclerae]|uniref:YbaN family protein n=1 Tax=Endozoicomonas arenosclerae TaxID=1633495 RepID=UPI001FE19647|nr:YbaN family protein [Endozoicomonas arenosclerae]
MLLVIAGLLSLVAGVMGIVLPLLPTTPFLLLSAFCFARSSKRLHHWLMNHRNFGTLLSNWEKHRGMKASHKRRALLLTVLSFMLSIALTPLWEVQVFLVFMAGCVLTGISRISVIPDEPQSSNMTT